MKISGIYSITNKINNKCYYGSAKNIRNRWQEHRRLLNKNKHYNGYLQRAWNKYGADNFEFKIEQITLPQNLVSIEQYFIDWTRLAPHLFYNIAEDATSPMLGRKHTKETRQKMSIFQMTNNKGRKHTKEAKEKNRISHIGKQHTKQSIELLSINNARYWKGKKRSDEDKKKMSDAKKGRPTWASTHKEEMAKRMIGDKNPDYNHTIYTLRNIITNEIVSDTRNNFVKKYNISDKNINSVLNEKRKTVNNWTLVKQPVENPYFG